MQFCNCISTVTYIFPFQITICIILSCCDIHLCQFTKSHSVRHLKFCNFSLSVIMCWIFLFINLLTCLIISKWLSNFMSRTFYLTQMLLRKLIHSFIHLMQWFTALATHLGQKKQNPFWAHLSGIMVSECRVFLSIFFSLRKAPRWFLTCSRGWEPQGVKGRHWDMLRICVAWACSLTHHLTAREKYHDRWVRELG